MKSRGLQKSQFLNSAVNWEKFRSTVQTFIHKTQFFFFFVNWKKLRIPDKAAFKNPNWEKFISATLKFWIYG